MESSSTCPPPPQDIQELPSSTTTANDEVTPKFAIEKHQHEGCDPCKNDRNDNDNDDDDDDSISIPPCSRTCKLNLTSNMLFVVASFLYLLLSIYDLNYANLLLSENYDSGDDYVVAAASDTTGAGDVKTKAKQTTVDDYYYYAAPAADYETAGAEATDVDDDYYVFETKSGTWVSKYQIIYFVAALCFVLSGAVDFIQSTTLASRLLSIIFILAGGFGLFSAMLVEEYEYQSNIFNSVSVHLFMVEAIGLFLRHCRTERIAKVATTAAAPSSSSSSSSKQQQLLLSRLQCFVHMGDVSWITGTFMDVVLSYSFLRGTGNSVPFSIVGVVAAILWQACSLIYLMATCITECHVRNQKGQVEMSTAHETSSGDDSKLLENQDKV